VQSVLDLLVRNLDFGTRHLGGRDSTGTHLCLDSAKYVIGQLNLLVSHTNRVLSGQCFHEGGGGLCDDSEARCLVLPLGDFPLEHTNGPALAAFPTQFDQLTEHESGLGGFDTIAGARASDVLDLSRECRIGKKSRLQRARFSCPDLPGERREIGAFL